MAVVGLCRGEWCKKLLARRLGSERRRMKRVVRLAWRWGISENDSKATRVLIWSSAHQTFQRPVILTIALLFEESNTSDTTLEVNGLRYR
jgi:hypothetical protein